MRAVSMNPTDFVAGGLPTDFDGTIVQCRTVIWDYDGKADAQGNVRWTLAVRQVIQPDDAEVSGGKPILNYLSAGNVKDFAPSLDGEVPAEPNPPTNPDGSPNYKSEGVFFVPLGKKQQLTNSTNYAQAMEHLINASFPINKLSPDVRFWEGLHGHFDRVPQKKRPGLSVDTGEGKRAADILCLTQITAPGVRLGQQGAQQVPPFAPGFASPSVPSSAPLPVPVSPVFTPPPVNQAPMAMAAQAQAPVNGQPSALDTKIRGILLGVVYSGSPLTKPQLAQMVMGSSEFTDQEKRLALQRCVSPDFVQAGVTEGLWAYDGKLTFSMPTA